MLNDRPIRLTFEGKVESYDSDTDTWRLDWSRDPREYIPLILPPLSTESISFAKTDTVNSIVHQLRVQANAQYSASAGDPFPADSVYFAALDIFNWIGIVTIEGNQFFYANIPLLVTEWAITGRDIINDDLTDTFWQKIVCHLWCHISDDCTFSRQNYLALIQAIYDDSTLLDGQSWIRFMLILIGRKALTNLGFLRLDDADVADPATTCEPCP